MHRFQSIEFRRCLSSTAGALVRRAFGDASAAFVGAEEQRVVGVARFRVPEAVLVAVHVGVGVLAELSNRFALRPVEPESDTSWLRAYGVRKYSWVVNFILMQAPFQLRIGRWMIWFVRLFCNNLESWKRTLLLSCCLNSSALGWVTWVSL